MVQHRETGRFSDLPRGDASGQWACRMHCISEILMLRLTIGAAMGVCSTTSQGADMGMRIGGSDTRLFTRRVIRGIAALGAVLASQIAAAAYVGPLPYLSSADQPWIGTVFSSYILETFEGGSLSAPGVSVDHGSALGPSALTDSVDADDGAIDGSGTAGHSWYSAGNASMTFSFDPIFASGLPTHIGIVITDVGITTGSVGIGNFIIEAFDAGNVSLGVSGPFVFGDGSVQGGTAEDRFVGVIDTAGISRLTVTALDSTDWEVDHLQFGERALPACSIAQPPTGSADDLLCPEPGTLLLLAGGLIGIVRRRR